MDAQRQRAFGEKLAAYKPVKWDDIPDLGLYMDQVITYLSRELRPICPSDERMFTPAMVNNYVKKGLVSRPVGKKYGREQLSQLLMICLLKQGASVEDVKRLLRRGEGEDARALYERFSAAQCETFSSLAASLPLGSAMLCAVRNAANRLLLEDMLCGLDTAEEAAQK